MPKPKPKLTHFDARGLAHMVDVGAKPSTSRMALAAGQIEMSSATLDIIAAGTASKGDVLGIARVAGIMAAKRTSELVPLCHPLALTSMALDFGLHPARAGKPAFVSCQARAETFGPTGVEMEALAAVQVALLTIYDMCKALDRGMTMSRIRLLEKRGGKSGNFIAAD